jgi:hypothetical protein
MSLIRGTEIHEEFELNMTQADAFEKVVAAYGVIGKIKSQQNAFFRIEGKIGSGFGNMNLASVTVQVKRISDTSCTLVLDAIAKEGVINQNTAPKAVSRLLEAIQ